MRVLFYAHLLAMDTVKFKLVQCMTPVLLGGEKINNSFMKRL